jgi:hypothetical protein
MKLYTWSRQLSPVWVTAPTMKPVSASMVCDGAAAAVRDHVPLTGSDRAGAVGFQEAADRDPKGTPLEFNIWYGSDEGRDAAPRVISARPSLWTARSWTSSPGSGPRRSARCGVYALVLLMR